MGSFRRDREGNFRGIFGRNEINALIELFRSMAIRSALPSLFFGSGFFWCGDLRGLSRNRGRGCEGRPETVGCRLEGLLASQGAKESVQNLGGFGSDREEFRMPSSAEESEPVREPDLVFDLAG